MLLRRQLVWRRADWLKLIDREDLIDSTCLRARVCEAHFSRGSIMLSSNRKLLRKNSIPQLLLPLPENFANKGIQTGVELEDEASVPGPHCSVCSKAITGFVFVCVQCNVRACGACDARGQHAQHYVLRAPCGSAEEELKEVVIKVREAISSAGLELSPAPRAQRTKDDGKEQADEQEDDENSYGNFELKTEIKLEVDVDDEDPLRSSEYEDIYSSSAPEASGSQVVPEPKEVKTELPDTPTASHSQTSSAGAASPPSPRSPRSPPSPSPPSPPSEDSDDSKPLAKRKRVISESKSPAATMKPGKRKSTSDTIVDPGSPSVAGSRHRLKKK